MTPFRTFHTFLSTLLLIVSVQCLHCRAWTTCCMNHHNRYSSSSSSSHDTNKGRCGGRSSSILIQSSTTGTATSSATITTASSTCVRASIGNDERDGATNENFLKEQGNKQDNEEMLGAWIPLASAQGLTGLGPQRIRVMGMDLVVWYTTSTTTATTTTTTQQEEEKEGRSDEKQIWSAQIDACTHRLAPLSQGRVNPNTKCIECPYHGWQFDSQGTVTCIPQLETNRSIESVRKQGGNVKTFPVHAVGDLLFVFLPSSVHGETFEQSLLPEDYYYPYLSSFMETTQEQRQGTRKQTKQSTRPVFVRELPYSFDFLVENFMDPAHIPFAHHKLQSTRADGVPIEMSEISSNFTHVAVGFKDVTRKRPRDAYASFQRPSFYHYGEYDITRQEEEEEEEEGNQQQQQQQGESTTPSSMSTTTTTTVATKTRQPKLCIWITPIEAGKCRVFFQSPPIRVPTFLLHAGSNRFLNSDTWLHDAEREVVKRKQELSATANNDDKKRMKLAQMDYIYASQSDVGVSVFRKWWIEHGMADAPPNTFAMATMEQLGPKSLSRREQIDPWENHTKHCSTCRKTLGTIKRSQKVLLFLSIASGILTGGRTSLQRPPIIGLVSAGIFLYGHMFLKKLATVMEGNPEVSNVPDRSSAANAAD